MGLRGADGRTGFIPRPLHWGRVGSQWLPGSEAGYPSGVAGYDSGQQPQQVSLASASPQPGLRREFEGMKPGKNSAQPLPWSCIMARLT